MRSHMVMRERKAKEKAKESNDRKLPDPGPPTLLHSFQAWDFHLRSGATTRADLHGICTFHDIDLTVEDEDCRTSPAVGRRSRPCPHPRDMDPSTRALLRARLADVPCSKSMTAQTSALLATGR